jgi:hypothetical protein
VTLVQIIIDIATAIGAVATVVALMRKYGPYLSA